MEERKIVFVCTGNTCRSPMAEAILRSELKRLHIDGISVMSAGIEAAKNGNINPKSAAVLSENGLSLENFNSRMLDRALLENAYAFVCMTDGQRDILMDIRWNILRKAGAVELENNVYSFSELAGYEIPDPFGKDLNCYRQTFVRLSEGMSAIIGKLCKIEAEKTKSEKREAGEKKPRKPRAKPRKKVGAKNAGRKVSASASAKRKSAKTASEKKKGAKAKTSGARTQKKDGD